MTEVFRSEPDRSQPPLERGGALDALRFLAAFAMVLYHYADQAPVSLFTLHPGFERGYLATNFFIMLSGYVLGRTYGPRFDRRQVDTRAFLTRRFVRIWPAHLVMIGAFIALYFAALTVGVQPRNPQWFDWGQLPAQVFLVQAWGVPGRSGWNIVTWSLSALLVCYALFPCMWRALGRLRSPLLILLACVLFWAATDAFARAVLDQPLHRLQLRWGVIRALPFFLVGVGLARIGSQTGLPFRWGAPAAAAALVAAVALQLLGEHDELTLGLLAAAIFAAGSSRTRGSPVIRAAAGTAFALFLTNYFVGVAWFGALTSVQSALALGNGWLWAGWAIAPGLALIFAWLFQTRLDDPLQAWLKSRLDRPREPRAVFTMA